MPECGDCILLTHEFIDGFAARLGPAALAVCITLKRHEEADNLSHPSIPTIATESDVSERAVVRALKRIVALGLVTIEYGSKPGTKVRVNHYKLSGSLRTMQMTTATQSPLPLPHSHPSQGTTANLTGVPLPHSHPSDADSCARIITAARKRKSKTLSPVPTAERALDPPGFADFWKSYPRNEDRKKAAELWRKLHPTEALIVEIMAGLERAKAGETWREGFIPYAFRWLRDERWKDVPGLFHPGTNQSAEDPERARFVAEEIARNEAREVEWRAKHPKGPPPP